MSVFGVNEFGARFPVALATVGWFLATGLLARRVVGTWSAGLAGALTLAMFTGTFFFTHLVMPEPFLSCFLTLSFWALLKATQMTEWTGAKRRGRPVADGGLVLHRAEHAHQRHSRAAYSCGRTLFHRVAGDPRCAWYGEDFFSGRTVGFCFWRFWRHGIWLTE